MRIRRQMDQGTVHRARGGSPPPLAPARRKAAMIVAAFASPETARIGREAGFPVAVLAAVSDPARHAARLSREWHASWAPREGWFAPFDFFYADAGASTYAQLPMDPRWMGRHALPAEVRLDAGGLIVEVPMGSGGDFAAAFAAAVADRSLGRIASKPGAVRRRHASGRPLSIAPRYSCDPGSTPFGTRCTLADDLVAFHPRDLPAIANAAASAAAVVALRASLARLPATHAERRHA